MGAMLLYNEIKEGTAIIFDGAPHQVISSYVFRKQQRKPVNATKLRNLITGKVFEHSFHQSDKVEETELSEKEVTYLYSHRDEHWFSEHDDKSKRFKLTAEETGEQIKFVPPNSPVYLLFSQDQIIGLKIPIKIVLRVKEAPPSVRGNTSQGGTKKVVLETGAEVNTPLFIKEGDSIIINTQTGEYVSRE